MRIVITSPFIDKFAEDPEEANVPAGKKMNVTADRGQELIDLGLAEVSEGEAQAPVAAAAKPARARTKTKPKPAAPIEEPAPAPIVAAETGSQPIALGSAGPVDGHPADEDTTHD